MPARLEWLHVPPASAVTTRPADTSAASAKSRSRCNSVAARLAGAKPISASIVHHDKSGGAISVMREPARCSRTGVEWKISGLRTSRESGKAARAAGASQGEGVFVAAFGRCPASGKPGKAFLAPARFLSPAGSAAVTKRISRARDLLMRIAYARAVGR